MSFWSWYHDNGIIPNIWKGITGQASSEKINDQNLDFQREQFEYQKQLNQQQMEREDTAYQRAAADAQAVGINPMALAGSGGAQSSPLNSSSFGGSSAQGDPGAAVSLLSTIFNAKEQALNGSAQRDLIESEADKNRLQALIQAHDYGFMKSENGKWVFDEDNGFRSRRFWDDINERLKTIEERDRGASASRNERVNIFQDKYGTTDQSSPELQKLKDLENLIIDQGTSHERNGFKNLKEKIDSILSDVKSSPDDTWLDDYLGSVPKPKSSKRKKGAEKRIRNNQANYYNRMVRNNYENANK